MNRYAHVLSPIDVGGVTIKNRVVRTAHVTMLGLEGPGGVSERLIAYHEARARGGVGLTVMEICSTHPSSPAPLNVWDPKLPGALERLVAAVRPHGMRLFQQLWHGGHNVRRPDGSPPWSASNVPSPYYGTVPLPMTRTMIDDVVAGFAAGTRMSQSSGLDGVEVHAAHGYLIHQFLSPVTNRRTDHYGGSLENRMRLLVDVLRASRGEARHGFAVGVRLACDCVEGGLGVDENVAILRRLQDEALVDFVSVSLGSYFAMPKIIGGMDEPTGYQLDSSLPIAAAATVPTMVTGRFRTLEEAEQVIRQRQADMVGFTRATIADPDLVRKSAAGSPDQVRPCIACNQACIGNELSGKALGCTVNPAVGFERRLSEEALVLAPRRKRVLVVGGGPSGMEAARIAALRGHEVVLAEASKALGGRVNLAARAPHRITIRDVTDWLEREIRRLNVEVRLNTFVDLDDVPEIAPDAVIVATGSLPRMDGCDLLKPGVPVRWSEGAAVFSSDEILTMDRSRIAGRYVVQDDVGHYEGIAVTEYLLSRGADVFFVTRFPSFAPLMQPALTAVPALERLSATKRFTLRTHARLDVIEQRIVRLSSPMCAIESVPFDGVVLISHNAPCRDLFDALRGRFEDLHLVGDANSPRFLEVAIREGHLAGRAV